MALTQKEREIAEFGKANGKTKNQVLGAIAKYRRNPVKEDVKQDPSESFIKDDSLSARVSENISDRGERVFEAISGTGEFQGDSAISRGVAATAEAAGGVSSTAFEVMPEPVRNVITSIGDKIGKGFGYVTDKLADTPLFRGAVAGNPDDLARLESSLGVVSDLGIISGEVLGTQGAVNSLKTTGNVSKKVGSAVSEAGKDIVDNTTAAISKPITGTLDKVVDSTQGIREKVGTLADRRKTNIENDKFIDETIKELPTDKAQKAVKDGVDIQNVRKILDIDEVNKPELKAFADEAIKYAEGKSKVDPIELVGQPIVQKVKSLDVERQAIGKRLGEAADNLGDVTPDELNSAITSSLNGVKGLEGLKVVDGTLDFSDTTLRSSLSKADQTSIQKAFTEAINSTSGKQAHLYRQELFEILGGKKKSLSNITDTQERAFEAIRKGISDLLDTKDANYKAINNDYRKVIQPLSDMRKLMKGIDPESEDLLNLSAGLIARRLNSNASSNPKIRQILKDLDNATSNKTDVGGSVEALQDMYSILDEYYSLEKGGTFKGLIESALPDVTPAGALTGAVKNIGESFTATDAVRQKALRDLLDEVLNASATK